MPRFITNCNYVHSVPNPGPNLHIRQLLVTSLPKFSLSPAPELVYTDFCVLYSTST